MSKKCFENAFRFNKSKQTSTDKPMLYKAKKDNKIVYMNQHKNVAALNVIKELPNGPKQAAVSHKQVKTSSQRNPFK